MKIVVKETDFFFKILRLFKDKERLTFEIDTENFKLSLSRLNAYYVNLEVSLFAIEGVDEVMFTVNPNLLLRHLHFFKSGMTMLIGKFLVLQNTDKDVVTEIRIPLNSTEEHGYVFLEPNTKVLLKNIDVIRHFAGITTYELRNEKLVLTKTVNETKDVLVMDDVEWLEARDLYFVCDNDWTKGLDTLSDCVESVLLEFSPYVLSVKFLFKHFHGSYLEIQVPKSVQSASAF